MTEKWWKKKGIRMKVSKFRFAVLVLLAVTVFYAVVLYQNIQAYSEYKRSVIEKHPEIEPYIDFAPFWVSSYGAPCLLVGIMLTMFWIGLLASLKANIKRNYWWNNTTYLYWLCFCFSSSLRKSGNSACRCFLCGR